MMRVLAVLAASMLLGCSGDGTPTGPLLPDIPDRPNPPQTQDPPARPSPSPTALATVWGLVIDDYGGCIADVTVEVIGGQATGRSARQETPCAKWDYGGGFTFRDLTPGVPLILRIAAPGYATMTETIIPSLAAQPAFLFSPSRE